MTTLDTTPVLDLSHALNGDVIWECTMDHGDDPPIDRPYIPCDAKARWRVRAKWICKNACAHDDTLALCSICLDQWLDNDEIDAAFLGPM